MCVCVCVCVRACVCVYVCVCVSIHSCCNHVQTPRALSHSLPAMTGAPNHTLLHLCHHNKPTPPHTLAHMTRWKMASQALRQAPSLALCCFALAGRFGRVLPCSSLCRPSLSAAFFRSLALSLSCSLAVSLSCSLALVLSCSLALSLSRSLALSLSRSLALSLSRSLALSLSRSLALSLSREQDAHTEGKTDLVGVS